MASPCNATYFLLSMLIIFFLVVYVVSPTFTIFPKFQQEKFADEKPKLWDPAKILVYQGSSLPDEPAKPVEYDNHESLPTVDGTDKAPRSMFMMAFNKCDPSCCPSSYSCSGGCVCMTDEQKNFLGNRGNNGKGRCGNQKEY